MIKFWTIIGHDFRRFDMEKNDILNYCSIWYLKNFLSIGFGVIESTVTVALNAIISVVFIWVIEFQKLRYKTE